MLRSGADAPTRGKAIKSCVAEAEISADHNTILAAFAFPAKPDSGERGGRGDM